MKSFPTTGEDSKPDSPIQRILDGAFGIPLFLTEAPTTAGNQLPHHGDNGFYGTHWYINLGGSTYSLALTLV